jgi:hypothetical protein
MEKRSFRDSPPLVEQRVFDGGTEGARRATGVAPSFGRAEEPAIQQQVVELPNLYLRS